MLWSWGWAMRKKTFTTETQRHRGRPRKGIIKVAGRLGILQIRSRGDREHREYGDHICVASVSSVPVALSCFMSTTEAQSHREKSERCPHKAGYRLVILQGEHKARAHRDTLANNSVFSVSSASTEHDSDDKSAKSHITAPYFLRFSSVSLCLCGEQSSLPTETTSPITLCSLSPPPPLCTTPTTKAQNRASRRPIFLGFPLCLCASVVNILP
jgi:hypothetical protein